MSTPRRPEDEYPPLSTDDPNEYVPSSRELAQAHADRTAQAGQDGVKDSETIGENGDAPAVGRLRPVLDRRRATAPGSRRKGNFVRRDSSDGEGVAPVAGTDDVDSVDGDAAGAANAGAAGFDADPAVTGTDNSVAVGGTIESDPEDVDETSVEGEPTGTTSKETVSPAAIPGLGGDDATTTTEAVASVDQPTDGDVHWSVSETAVSDETVEAPRSSLDDARDDRGLDASEVDSADGTSISPVASAAKTDGTTAADTDGIATDRTATENSAESTSGPVQPDFESHSQATWTASESEMDDWDRAFAGDAAVASESTNAASGDDSASSSDTPADLTVTPEPLTTAGTPVAGAPATAATTATPVAVGAVGTTPATTATPVPGAADTTRRPIADTDTTTVSAEEAQRRAERRQEALTRKPVGGRIWQVLLALIFPFVLMAGAVRLVASPLFLWIEYHRPGFPADQFGFSSDDRLTYGSAVLDYITNFANPRYLTQIPGPEGGSLLTENEVSHMVDVKNVVGVVWVTAAILAVIAIIGIIYLARRYMGGVRRGLFAGSIITLVTTIALAIAGIFGWSGFFTTFHEIFFSQGNWQFYQDDVLIRLFPTRFWIDAAATVAIIVLAVSIVTLIATWPTKARRQRSRDKQSALMTSLAAQDTNDDDVARGSAIPAAGGASAAGGATAPTAATSPTAPHNDPLPTSPAPLGAVPETGLQNTQTGNVPAGDYTSTGAGVDAETITHDEPRITESGRGIDESGNRNA